MVHAALLYDVLIIGKNDFYKTRVFMKLLKLTHISVRSKIWIKAYCLMAISFMFGSFAQAQRCNNLGLRTIPTYICGDAAGVASHRDTILPWSAADTWVFTNISGGTSGTISGLGVVSLSWSAPGDYVFSIAKTNAPVCQDTFRVRVGSSFAPQAVCKDTVNISLDENCTAVVTPDLILKGVYNYSDFEVIIKDQSTGLVIPSNPVVSSAYKGKFLEVSIKHRCSNNSCWGILRIEDKLKPLITCRNFTVACDGNYSVAALGFPKPNPLAPNPVLSGTNTYTANSSYYDNCGAVTLKYSDRISHVDCPPASAYIDTVFRSWTITDMFGNTVSCVDTIYIQAGSLADVVCPVNWDGLPGNHAVINCSTSYPKDSKGNPSPSYTGYPTKVTCRNINYTYNDITIKACEGTFKILREWIIADWCTATQKTCIQLIKVADSEAPILSGAPNMTVSTGGADCTGYADVPVPTIIQECNPNSITWEVRVIRNSPNCALPPAASNITLEESTGISRNANGTYRIINLPVGCSWVRFYGTDGCGNKTQVATEVLVQEKTKPVAICDLQTIVTLTDAGTAKVLARTFDDGSYDNCAVDSFSVRRMNAASCPSPVVSDLEFRNFVEFCCADVKTNPNIVVFRVYDRSGNYNECMVEVTVVDKKPPVIVQSLPNITVSCGFDISNLSIFGNMRTAESDRKNITINDPGNTSALQPKYWGRDGLVSEDCNLDSSYSVSNGLNSCGVGSIVRTWRFTDGVNPAVIATQTITVVNFSPFNLNTVVFPPSITTVGCRNSADPSLTGRPTWTASSTCSNVIASSEDQVFNIVEGVCYKILRKWTVVDWCQYNPATGVGLLSRTQVIKIANTVPPTITTNCNNVTVDAPGPNCDGTVNLSIAATDDCTPLDDLTYTYKIDIGNNGSIDVTGTGSTHSSTYAVGTHKINWVVEDVCGNSAQCSYTFTVRDAKKPTPVCRNGIVTVIMPSNGSVAVWASDLNLGSYDNCTNSVNLVYRFTNGSTSKTYTCSDIPDGISKTFTENIYVYDAAGNSDFCTVEITIQDGIGNACPDNFGGGGTNNIVIGGSLTNEAKSSLENAMVTINGSMPSMPKYQVTLNDGHYVFTSLPLNEDYSIIAEKNDDHLNGVTTQDIVTIQKHILGIAEFTSAYKVIAADVNNSETITARDIADLRKLILGVTTDFPQNKSWRFINSNQKFPNPLSPWPLQESYSFVKLGEDQMESNFIAVKIGDVTGNAKTSQLGANKQREARIVGLNIKDEAFESGKRVELPILLEDIKWIQGLQLELQFDPSILEFDAIQNGVCDLSESNMNLMNIEQGVIKISWDNLKGVVANKPLFKIAFLSKQNAKWSDVVAIPQRNHFSSEVYNEQNEASELRVQFIQDDQSKSNGFYLYQNQPNPFNEATSIAFQLPKDGEARLVVFDINGKVIKEIKRFFKQGYHAIELNKQDIGSSGMLYYSLESGDYKSVRKMILIN